MDFQTGYNVILDHRLENRVAPKDAEVASLFYMNKVSSTEVFHNSSYIPTEFFLTRMQLLHIKEKQRKKSQYKEDCDQEQCS